MQTCLANDGALYSFAVDIPEEEARYWTRKLEQINSLGDDEVNI